MNAVDRNQGGRKSGVALVIVLGLLALLTTLAVAFAISMRVEQMAAQNFSNAVRAQQLTHVGVTRAMSWIHNSMTNPIPVVYPRWATNGVLTEAVASTGGVVNCTDILSGEAANAIPGFLLPDAQAAALNCKWVSISNSSYNLRYAYLIVNDSGLLDANYIGGTNRVWSESLREIDISNIRGIANTNDFFINRFEDVRYESQQELQALQGDPTRGAGLNTNAIDLFWYSYDPGRDMGFVNEAAKTTQLGWATNLVLKFNVNQTNLFPYVPANAVFTNYMAKLADILRAAGIGVPPNTASKTEDVFWNIVNWVDTDRYPQNSYGLAGWPTNLVQAPNPAFCSTEGGEALPLINEVAILPVLATNIVVGPPGFTNVYTNCKFAVELWYPFVVVNETWTNGGTVNYSLRIDTFPTNGSAEWDIAPMAYATTNEFRWFLSNVMTNGTNGLLTASVRAVVFDGAVGDTNRRPVDAAMNRQAGATWDTIVKLSDFTVGEPSQEVDDPRSNGKDGKNSAYWKPCLTTNTLGGMNTRSDPWGTTWPGTIDRQGLPIYVKNGPMENVGEIGYIPFGNREAMGGGGTALESKWYWCNLDLMNKDEGAYMLDYVTVYPTNRSGYGFVAMNTRDDEVLRALFPGMMIGWANQTTNLLKPLDTTAAPYINAVVSNIIDRTIASGRGAIAFRDLFDGAAQRGGPVAEAFRALGTNWWTTQPGVTNLANDKVREDGFRNIIEMITFRQNIFTIVVATQVMSSNGRTVEAEKRALCTVYRDSYTGSYFIRSFKWLK
jgi:hypothetical protein